jgi:serine/threonine protein kinase
MKEISHPNLAEVGHFGIYKNQYYYTMPYYQTTDPNSYCIENGQRAFLYILTELLRGLSF